MGKRMKSIISAMPNKEEAHSVDTVLGFLKEHSRVKFVESVDVAVRLGVDVRKNQVVRGAVTLPHGTGKTVRVAVFAQGDAAEAARDAGADIVGYDDLAKQISNGDMNFDVVIATPAAMAVVGKLGQVLGPKGLMPNPKMGTVTNDVAQAVKQAKAGQARFRTDKNGIIHCAVGLVNFEVSALTDNLNVLLQELKKLKPSDAKGVYFEKISLSTTMGPGLEVDKATVTLV